LASMLAIISDIHGNLEAFQAVLDDISKLENPVDGLICLGDIVGYGPNPQECCDQLREYPVDDKHILMGNHDYSVIHPEMEEWFNPVARVAIRWTRDHLDASTLVWMESLAHRYEAGNCLYVHGTPRDPLTEYMDETLAPYLVRNWDFDVCFVAHTHRMGFYIGQEWIPVRRDRAMTVDRRMIVNVGSTGQPRDGNPRAGYCLWDPATRHLEFRRRAYDFACTQDKIDDAGLPHFLAERLALGR